jgi:tRNA pseudouridine32 synthase/23S rRNA pseudouridine746 synthase
MTRPTPAWTPAMRDGVNASRVAVTAGPTTRLADYLAARLPAGDDWPARLAAGEVLDAMGRPLPPDAHCTQGAVLWYWRRPPPEPRVPFEIEVLHQDEHLVVVDKPHFLPVTPGGRHLHETVLVRLRKLLNLQNLVPVHRLDLETAGLVVFSVRPQDRHAYHALLRDRQVHKVYEAVAPWRDDLTLPHVCESRLIEPAGEDFMQMQTVAGEPNALTRIELISRLGEMGEMGEMAHYRLMPLTGRKHQLRVHLCALGLPILGDRIYPRLWPQAPLGQLPDYSQPLQLLARGLAFADPVTGQSRSFFSRRQLARAEQPGTAVPRRPTPSAIAAPGPEGRR